MNSPALRLVPRASRPSVIVDAGRGQRMTPPLTLDEIDAMQRPSSRVPHAVFCATCATLTGHVVPFDLRHCST